MKSAGCVCSKNGSVGRATAGRSAGSLTSKMTKPADSPMFPRRPADFIFFVRRPAGRLPVGRRFSEFPPLASYHVCLVTCLVTSQIHRRPETITRLTTEHTRTYPLSNGCRQTDSIKVVTVSVYRFTLSLSIRVSDPTP